MAWTMLPSLTLQSAVKVAVTATATAMMVLRLKRDAPSPPSDSAFSTASLTASARSLMTSHDILAWLGNPISSRSAYRERAAGTLPHPVQDRLRRHGHRLQGRARAAGAAGGSEVPAPLD